MSTPLQAICIVVSGNVYFVIVIFETHGQKMRFSESSQNSMFEKSIFGHFEVILFQHIIFSRVDWFIPGSTFNEEYFNEKMSSLAGLNKKVIHFSTKVTFLAIFDYLGSHSNSIFSTYRQKFEKSSVNFLG